MGPRCLRNLQVFSSYDVLILCSDAMDASSDLADKASKEEVDEDGDSREETAGKASGAAVLDFTSQVPLDETSDAVGGRYPFPEGGGDAEFSLSFGIVGALCLVEDPMNAHSADSAHPLFLGGYGATGTARSNSFYNSV